MYKKLPSMRVIVGLFLILLSYVICWPVIFMLGAISYYMGNPLILVIGGPLVYGLSNLVFLVGVYYAGKDYAVKCLHKFTNRLRKYNG